MARVGWSPRLTTNNHCHPLLRLLLTLAQSSLIAQACTLTSSLPLSFCPKMYRPLLSSTMSARIEREDPTFHERFLSRSRVPSFATSGPRLNEQFDKGDQEDWETETYVDGTPPSSQLSSTTVADIDESRGQETTDVGKPSRLISHGI